MNTLETLVTNNPQTPLHSCMDAAFLPFGRVLKDLPTGPMIEWMQSQVSVAEGTGYQRSVGALEDLPGPGGRTWKQWASSVFYGGFPAEVGWCAGKNQRLNAFEYHKASEINIACTDLVLLVGRLQDMKDYSHFDSRLVQGFFVPCGTVVELYATTLHFAPIMTAPEGFLDVVILPLGTNAPLEKVNTAAPGEEGLLWMTNKWLLACADSKPAQRGARVGISSNIEIRI